MMASLAILFALVMAYYMAVAGSLIAYALAVIAVSWVIVRVVKIIAASTGSKSAENAPEPKRIGPTRDELAEDRLRTGYRRISATNPRFAGLGGRFEVFEAPDGIGCDIVAYAPPSIDLAADGGRVLYMDLRQDDPFCGVEGRWHATVKRVQVIREKRTQDEIDGWPLFAPTVTSADTDRADVTAALFAVDGALAEHRLIAA